MTKSCSRLAVTQRIVNADGYREKRDALAHDWYRLFEQVMPTNVFWSPFPNCGENATEMFIRGGFDGLLLTGGETPGTSPLRDKTESLLLDYAVVHQLPILAICRGLQFLVKYFGGSLLAADPQLHVATRHQLIWLSEDKRSFLDIEKAEARELDVNSFHSFNIDGGGLPECFEVLATTCGDQAVEAVRHRNLPILGLMWHPEREKDLSLLDRHMITEVFGWSK